MCSVTLSAGGGSCALTASKLKAGLYHVQARYLGNASFNASASATKALTVTT